MGDGKLSPLNATSEATAYRLLLRVAEIEGWPLAQPRAPDAKPTRKLILDRYSDCLEAVTGNRQKAPPRGTIVGSLEGDDPARRTMALETGHSQSPVGTPRRDAPIELTAAGTTEPSRAARPNDGQSDAGSGAGMPVAPPRRNGAFRRSWLGTLMDGFRSRRR